MDVMEEGRMAIALDTTGAPLGLWQAGQPGRRPIATMSHRAS